MTADPLGRDHVARHLRGLLALERRADVVFLWGRRLATVLGGGGRLLIAGNGGSAAEAQHLAAELVGRFRTDRPAYSAIALHAETSSLTAIANDYDYKDVFARQVEAHGRAGDVLLLLSTSGSSANLLAATVVAREMGIETWALTGPSPNPLQRMCDETIDIPDPDGAVVQEIHLVGLHLLCEAFDHSLQAHPTLAPGWETAR
jgi:D-sedoheptulose 7-phosphate isomerase